MAVKASLLLMAFAPFNSALRGIFAEEIDALEERSMGGGGKAAKKYRVAPLPEAWG